MCCPAVVEHFLSSHPERGLYLTSALCILTLLFSLFVRPSTAIPSTLRAVLDTASINREICRWLWALNPLQETLRGLWFPALSMWGLSTAYPDIKILYCSLVKTTGRAAIYPVCGAEGGGCRETEVRHLPVLLHPVNNKTHVTGNPLWFQILKKKISYLCCLWVMWAPSEIEK